MSSKLFSYVTVKGVISTVIATLLILTAIGFLARFVTFSSPMWTTTNVIFTLIATLMATSVIFIVLSYVLSQVIQKIESRTGVILYITLAVFASIELCNILTSVVTRSTYYPGAAGMASQIFWINRLLNFVISGISAVAVVCFTNRELKTLLNS